MKKILQAIDGASKKASAGTDNEMKRFVSIISEGRGPTNRATQAEQMVIQHYTKLEQPIVEKKKTTTSIDRYFKAVEQELLESTQHEQSKKQAKAQKLAERAIKEVGGNHGHFSKLRTHLSRAERPPEDIVNMAKSGARVDSKMRNKIHKEETEGVDSVTVDIPLMIRLLEFAREDAKDDMILHQVVERMIGMKEEGQALSMSDYENIVGQVDESLLTDNPCWKGYKPVGTKKKNGKTVPNCVPKK